MTSLMERSIVVMLLNPSTWGRVEEFGFPEPNTGCVLWMGHVDKDGYPKMTGPRFDYKRVAVTVSRLVLARKIGRVPNKALHTCDTRCCIAENHLYDGDDKQNVADMYNRKRRIIVRDQYGKIT